MDSPFSKHMFVAIFGLCLQKKRPLLIERPDIDYFYWLVIAIIPDYRLTTPGISYRLKTDWWSILLITTVLEWIENHGSQNP